MAPAAPRGLPQALLRYPVVAARRSPARRPPTDLPHARFGAPSPIGQAPGAERHNQETVACETPAFSLGICGPSHNTAAWPRTPAVHRTQPAFSRASVWCAPRTIVGLTRPENLANQHECQMLTKPK